MIDLDDLPPNHALDLLQLPLPAQTLPPAQTLSGVARVGLRPLGTVGGAELGVWQMSPSVSTDVEADECFVVLAGEATVEFEDGRPALNLRPGSLVRLAAGSRTTWTVRQTLRKLYLLDTPA